MGIISSFPFESTPLVVIMRARNRAINALRENTEDENLVAFMMKR